MIFVGGNKAFFCKGDYHPAEFYKGNKKIAGYTMTEFGGEVCVTLEDCYNDRIYNAFTSAETGSITVRGKNRFNKALIPSSGNSERYHNGFKATKTTANNRCGKIEVEVPSGNTLKITLDVIASEFSGTNSYITMVFFDSDKNTIASRQITSTPGRKEYSVIPSANVVYVEWYFQADNGKNPVGDYMIMDNIMLRTEGDDNFESYIQPRVIEIVSGEITGNIPTFKGTTVIEGVISGKYKKQEA